VNRQPPWKYQRAAVLLAEGAKSESDIAAELGIDESTLWRWKRRPEFAERVRAEATAIAEQVRAASIANRQVRVDAAIDRYQRLRGVIDARAAHYAERRAGGDLKVAPGAETGVMASRPKPGKWRTVEEFRVDVGLLKEMRELEVQVAKDLGQWEERQRVDVEITIRQLARELGLDEEEALAEAKGILQGARAG